MALALLLAGCVPPDGQTPPVGFKANFEAGMARDPLTGNSYASDRVFIGPADPAFPRPDVTYATFDLFHGVQVEYFAPDGGAYLWYPGDSRAVAGEWRVAGRDLCFRYGRNTFNPVTRQGGGEWECRSRSGAATGVVGLVAGDPYGLRRGKVPAHDLRTCRLPAGMLLRKQMTCIPKA